MRVIQSILLTLAITLSATGCVLVLGTHHFPGHSNVIVIDDEVYVVDKESKTLRLIDEDDDNQIEGTTEASDSDEK